MGIKQYVKDWMSEKWDQWVKQPIADYTIKMENSAKDQFNKYGNQAKTTARKPLDYYNDQKAFHRGLFWIAVALLIVLWILSGS